MNPINIHIIDYEMGNIFSITQACLKAGMNPVVTNDRHLLEKAEAIILPGVGAFGDAMKSLRRLDLCTLLQDKAQSDSLIVGICLGLQLFMSESEEFGSHQGLGLISGPVVKFNAPSDHPRTLKVPHVGWSSVHQGNGGVQAANAEGHWAYEGLRRSEHMYFVHSFHARPENRQHVASLSIYEDIEFCSSISARNLLAFQFHPEKSGVKGMRIYSNIANHLNQKHHAK